MILAGALSSDKHHRQAASSIFVQYATIFRVVLPRWIPICSQHQTDQEFSESDELILPSDEDWRQRVYYTLVQLQRECDAEIASKRSSSSPASEMEYGTAKDSNSWEWLPGRGGYPLRAKVREDATSVGSLTGLRDISGSMTEACIEPGWRISDILLAARVLQKCSPPPTYADEAEMRRVFGLVYDVLRYKNILRQVLDDVAFWYQNRSMRTRERIAWLLLYDMQGRKFARFGDLAEVAERERMFVSAGLNDIEEKLVSVKTHLAASVSRLRIGGSALNLDELLPAHLRMMEGVSWGDQGSIASGWVNTMKLGSKDEFTREMSKLGFSLCERCDIEELDEHTYTFDPLCPKIIHVHHKAREKLAVSSLVRKHRFVFLERSLCLGAAALAQGIRMNRLCGPVVLTHPLAPRHTGYLAGLLADIEDAGQLLAFGTSERQHEYEAYLSNLGVNLEQCRVYAEKYVSAPASAELERATIVLAVPPCSYTGLRDIVDLVVARGGDTDLLEQLTGSNETHVVDNKYPKALLAEQLATLKHALTMPNVQYLLYQAHTVLPSETTELVQQVVDYANRIAMEKHLRDHPPKKKYAKEPREAKGLRASRSGRLDQSQDEEEDPAPVSRNPKAKLPDSDVFEIKPIHDIYGEESSSLLDPGAFLTIIKRKEMMQFDSLFMIKVAESKGLFGDLTEPKPSREEFDPRARPSSQSIPREAKRSKMDIERIAAPTQSSLLRIAKQSQESLGKNESAVRVVANARSTKPSKSDSKGKVCLKSVKSLEKTGLSPIEPLRVPRYTECFVKDNLSVTLETPRLERTLPVESSTVLRSAELSRAVQRIPLEHLIGTSEAKKSRSKRYEDFFDSSDDPSPRGAAARPRNMKRARAVFKRSLETLGDSLSLESCASVASNASSACDLEDP